MVSSTVYGLEGFLDQVFAILEGYGYEVWMSHKGTIPTNPKSSGPNSRAITTRAPVRSARLAACEPSRAAPPRMVFSFRSCIAMVSTNTRRTTAWA